MDEAQFFPDLEEFCSTAADEDRKHVIVAGLDGDFKRQRFGQVNIPRVTSLASSALNFVQRNVSYCHDRCCAAFAKVLRRAQILELVPQADSVTKLAGKCSYCEAAGVDRPALFSLRIAADERQEVVGGADKYAPVCRHHYRSLSDVRQLGDAATAVGQ